MRITNKMITGDFLTNLNTNLTSLTKYQKQVATGKSLNSIADDPAKLIASLQAKTKLNKIDQYSSTVDTAVDWLTQTDSSVTELDGVLTNAYEKAVQASSDTLTDDDRNSIAEDIGQLRDQVLTIANNQYGDKYIFGGYNTSTKPFTTDASGNIFYNGTDLTDSTNADLISMDSQSVGYSVGNNITMGVSITGTELLGTGDNNAYTVLNNLYNALKSGSTGDDIGSYITQIQDCQSNVHIVQGKVGGLTNRLDMLKDIYSNQSDTCTEQKSEAEDADIAQAYTKYTAAQTVYNAALQVGTQILQHSILDYLD
jgi:flagellar hook-associated protein 3 FlgL